MAYEDLYLGDNSTTDDLVNNPWVNNYATRGLLSGVQLLSETLGKPARALFGTLAGKPKELLNLLPFSDMLGITNPNEMVGGRDLMREYGLVGPEDNWGNFAGGLALDIAADPLNWVAGPLGALTKAGTKAAKAGTLGGSVSKRIKAGEGGLFGIMDRPWYAEMLGMGKQNPVYTAGIDPFLQPQMQKVADAMESGWSKGTRFTIPGTGFSPLAWMRSAFEPGAANVTGHPVLVDVFGDTNQATYKKLAGDAADRMGDADIYGLQADAINKLADLGLDNEKAGQLLRRATQSQVENKALEFIQDWASPQQFAVAREFAEAVAPRVKGIADPARDASVAAGRNVGDVTLDKWQMDYFPRAKADSGNKVSTHATPRNENISYLPGGGAMADAMYTDDLYVGVKHTSHLLPANKKTADDLIVEGIQKWAPVIKSKAIDRLQKMFPGNAKDIPKDLRLLTTDHGAADLAAKIVKDAAESSPEVIRAGQFYRSDVAGELADHGRQMARSTAPAMSAIETLAREGTDYQKLISGQPSAENVYTLREAMNEIGLSGLNKQGLANDQSLQTLATRLGVNVDDLSKLGVKGDLVQALKKEINPLPPGEKSGWAKFVDAFRYGVTIPWPANIVRNWTSTISDQGLSGTGAFKNLGKAQDFLRGNLRASDPLEFRKWEATYQKAIEHGVVGTDQVHALLGEGFDKTGNVAMNTKPAQPGKTLMQSAKEWLRSIVSEDAGRVNGVVPLRELAAGSSMNPSMKKAAEYAGHVVDPVRRYMGTMEQAHHFQNEVTRLQQFANLMDEGYSARAAADRVKINQRDYLEGSTPFVQNKLRNFVPFANFSVQNLRAQADMLSRQPGRYSTLMNILNSGREGGGFVPGYASSGASIELPGAEPGQKRYLSSLGLTQEDEMMSGLASLMALRPEEGVRKIVSGMNPALKIPFEMATGTQVFSGRRLDDLKPSTAASVATLGMNPSAARFLTQLASGTPAARVFSTMDRIADYEKRGVGNLALNLLTGTRTVDVDQEMASQIAARDSITKLLNASDQYKLRDQLVVEPKWKGREKEMPESIRQLWGQYQLLQQAAKKAVQERQAAGLR